MRMDSAVGSFQEPSRCTSQQKKRVKASMVQALSGMCATHVTGTARPPPALLWRCASPRTALAYGTTYADVDDDEITSASFSD
jgi:hypothetical protein